MATSTSRTAEGVAFVRAIESLRRPDDRLFYDPLAAGFLSPARRLALAMLCLPRLAVLALARLDRRLPGVYGSFVCRTRFIDDALSDALREGARQVVILGAGFDSRAYRTPAIENTRIFELDRPAMLDVKRSRLQTLLNGLPSHVVYVPVDFTRDRFGETLSAAGYDPLVRTFFICEGVTQYVTAEAVDNILRQVTDSASGSRIAFTYTQRNVIDGTLSRNIDRRILSLVARLGEPWITGFDPDEMPDYLRQRGLAVVAHVHAPDFQSRYLRPLGRTLAIYDKERVVVAERVAVPADTDHPPPR